MTDTPDIKECHRRGMSLPEAARAMGVSYNCAWQRAKRAELVFPDIRAERSAERMRQQHKDPEFNPLVLLTQQERADYDIFKRAGCTRDEAFEAVGRVDLIGGTS